MASETYFFLNLILINCAAKGELKWPLFLIFLPRVDVLKLLPIMIWLQLAKSQSRFIILPLPLSLLILERTLQ